MLYLHVFKTDDESSMYQVFERSGKKENAEKILRNTLEKEWVKDDTLLEKEQSKKDLDHEFAIDTVNDIMDSLERYECINIDEMLQKKCSISLTESSNRCVEAIFSSE